MTRKPRSRGSVLNRPLGFLATQVVALGILAGVLIAASREVEPHAALPEVRTQPLMVAPLYDWPWVVSDEQLERTLATLRPRLRGPRPKINYVDHALRMWGQEVTFDEADCLSGPEMKAVLTDHRRFAAVWGDEPPLLIRKDTGVQVRSIEGQASASHVDHTLATLAEIGVPLDEHLRLPDGEATVRELLQASLLDFRLNQVEYEWTALAAALYAPSPRGWLSREGQHISFDLLADRIMRQRYGQGVCYGNHRLYTLAALLQVHDHAPILSADSRAAILAHLEEATARLVSTQDWEGWWDANWFDGHELPSEQTFDDRARRILATGHALEWWAIAPRDVLPPRDVIIRAAQWLVSEIDAHSPAELERNYTFLTHAGRALALWRLRNPYNPTVKFSQSAS